MKTNIYYFSGTGNTLKIAKALQDELIFLNQNASLIDITSTSNIPLSDTMVIAYPVYGFNPPKNVIDFVRLLPSDDKKVYFLKTSGEPLHLNDASSLALVKILERKGYVVCGEYHFIMPYNMIFRHSDSLASKMLLTAKSRLKVVAQEIASNQRRPILMPMRARLMRFVCKIEHNGLALNGLLYTIDKSKCVNCNKCVKLCPNKNITIKNGKFIFGSNCLGCVRCSFQCPTNAINIGLLNFLKVNGPYNFEADPGLAELPKFCHKSYQRYFDVENDLK